MENEATVSKNFIEQIIEEGLGRGSLQDCKDQIPTGAKRLFTHRPCEVYSFKLWTGKEV